MAGAVERDPTQIESRTRSHVLCICLVNTPARRSPSRVSSAAIMVDSACSRSGLSMVNRVWPFFTSSPTWAYSAMMRPGLQCVHPERRLTLPPASSAWNAAGSHHRRISSGGGGDISARLLGQWLFPSLRQALSHPGLPGEASIDEENRFTRLTIRDDAKREPAPRHKR